MTVVEQVLAPVVTERERRARVLEAAALEIEVRGWGQGPKSGYWQEGGPVCIVGGICAAQGLDTIPSLLFDGGVPDFDAADAAWGVHGGTDLWHWNDNHARTASDVTFVLRWRAQEIRDGR